MLNHESPNCEIGDLGHDCLSHAWVVLIGSVHDFPSILALRYTGTRMLHVTRPWSSLREKTHSPQVGIHGHVELFK